MPIASATARTLLPRGLSATFVPWIGVVLLSLLCFTAGTLFLRRLAGAFEVPLSPLGLLVVGAISATLAAAVRLTWPILQTSSRMPDRRAWQGTIQRSIPTAALVVLGLALSLPETSITGFLALWTFLFIEELWAWLPPVAFLRRFSTHPFTKPFSNPSRATSPLAVSRTLLSPAPEPKTTPSTLDPSITQNILRTTLADGLEMIRGQIRIPFVPGQRTAAAHMAFCPPFDQTPQVEFRQTFGPGARVKLAQVYPYGARFDLKLAAVASESTSVVLDFSVTGKSVAIL